MNWEYKFVDREPVPGLFSGQKAGVEQDHDFLATLNQLGAKGWGLVSLVSREAWLTAALKRSLAHSDS